MSDICSISIVLIIFIFFFNDTATTEIYTLSLHDALPIYAENQVWRFWIWPHIAKCGAHAPHRDRKSTRLNSSHTVISYAVFCLKKKNILKYIKSPIQKNVNLSKSKSIVSKYL